MANTPHLDTAKIYQFPIRTHSRGQHGAEREAAVVAFAPRRVVQASVASVGYDAWYHEAAIREERDRH